MKPKTAKHIANTGVSQFEPALSPKYQMPQLSHESLSAFARFPPGHLTHAVKPNPSATLPASQLLHTLAPVDAVNVPTPQLLHSNASPSSPEKDPGSHDTQSLDVSTCFVPGAHVSYTIPDDEEAKRLL